MRDMATLTAPAATSNRLTAPWAVLVFHDRKLQDVVPIGPHPLRIGRSLDCEIVIDEGSVSRSHCTLTRVDGCIVATDMESTNGTWRFGERIRRSALKNGDELAIGKAMVKLVELNTGQWQPHEGLYGELYLDADTGLHNRRGLRMLLDGCLGVLPPGTDVSVLLARMDGITELGQRRGTTVQQLAIAHVAALWQRDLPRGAITARLCLGDFAAVLPGLSAQRATMLGERLCASLKDMPLALASGACPLSIHVGVASQCMPLPSLHGLFCSAEDALFRACARGG